MHKMPRGNLCNPYDYISEQKLKKERAITTVVKKYLQNRVFIRFQQKTLVRKYVPVLLFHIKLSVICIALIEPSSRTYISRDYT